MSDVVCEKCGRPLTRVPQGWVDDTGSSICEKDPGIGHRRRDPNSTGDERSARTRPGTAGGAAGPERAHAAWRRAEMLRSEVEEMQDRARETLRKTQQQLDRDARRDSLDDSA